ncbi:MAG: cytochrome C oxidase subunit IV family protein [Planctomycetota bacterium]
MSESSNHPHAESHADHAGGAEVAVPHGKTTFIVFLCVAALTVLNVAASYLTVSSSLGVIIVMGLASLQVTLVALYFMHLRLEIKPVYIVVGVPVILTTLLVVALLPDIAWHEPAAGQPAAAVKATKAGN